MEKLSEFLIESKKVIEDPANWTTGWFARTRRGGMVGANDEWATCWCSLGALKRHAKPDIGDDLVCGVKSLTNEAMLLLVKVMGDSVEDFNDAHTHHEVMLKWDEAINLAKEQESV